MSLLLHCKQQLASKCTVVVNLSSSQSGSVDVRKAWLLTCMNRGFRCIDPQKPKYLVLLSHSTDGELNAKSSKLLRNFGLCG